MTDFNLGRTLRQARIDADLTQQKVADQLGISLWTYNRLENGRRSFEERWITLLPNGIRQPIIELLTNRAERQLKFLNGLNDPDAFAADRLEVA